ncbi:MAG: GAF domain-containing protein [archaeon]|nr:GAF domain-containing protein [archaeon]
MELITEDKTSSLYRERIAKEICAELNNFTDLTASLKLIMIKIQELANIDSISIRLKDGEDYPYYVYNGFDVSFIIHENSLCSKDKNGNTLYESDGKTPLLDCMCGNIIKGRTDPSFPFFTVKGSFWSNHTTELLKNTTEEDRQSNTRNFCNSSGYESVALIPIKSRGEIIGLIQLNDYNKNKFSIDLIEFLEMIGEQVGLAINNSLTYSKLKQTLEELQSLRKILPICSHCKKIRDDKGFWGDVENYLKKYLRTEVSHGICPECMEKHYSEYV